MTTEEILTTRQSLLYVLIGVGIALVYTAIFILVVNGDFTWIQEADAQILPFEQQLDQIRNPQDCTRKVVQGKSATIPFSLKVFYDTTRNNKLEFKQQGTSFPLVQRTNQVMTFYTNGTDQYEIYMEMNYDDAKPRLVYIEYLSANEIVQSEQEKFDEARFCMTIFVNTVLPTIVPTKEEIFGETLDYISKIPAMVTAFNANTITTGTAISYMWILILVGLIIAVLTLISSHSGKKRFDAKIRDLDDSIGNVNSMALKMDELVTNVNQPLNEIIVGIKTILNLPQIKEKIPQQKKESKFKKFIPSFKKKEKEVEPNKDLVKEYSENVVKHIEASEPKTESDAVLEALQPTQEEIEEEQQQQQSQQSEEEPSGGYITRIIESSEEEKVPPPPPPPPKEESPMKQRKQLYVDIINAIDKKEKRFKDGMFDKFTYNELCETYSWISDYRRWANKNQIEIPSEVLEKQEVSEKVIYYAIFAKMERKMRNGS